MNPFQYYFLKRKVYRLACKGKTFMHIHKEVNQWYTIKEFEVVFRTQYIRGNHIAVKKAVKRLNHSIPPLGVGIRDLSKAATQSEKAVKELSQAFKKVEYVNEKVRRNLIDLENRNN